MASQNQIPHRYVLVASPSQRFPGWINHKDRVIFFVRDGSDVLWVRTGHVCSQPGSHGPGREVDNVKKTIIWSDQVLNDLADHADDAHEICFDLASPYFLRADEARILIYPHLVHVWFNGQLHPRACVRISRLVRLSDFGLSGEEKCEAARFQRLIAGCKKIKHWWIHGHLPEGDAHPMKPFIT